MGVGKKEGKDVPHVAMHAFQRSPHEIQGCWVGLSLHLVLAPIRFNWMKEMKTLKSFSTERQSMLKV